MDLANFTPQQIDTKLAGLYAELVEAQISEDKAAERVTAYDVKTERGAELSAYDHRCYDAYTAELEGYSERVAEVRAQMRPYQDEHRHRPWSRFFAVADGHVHASMHCSTCNNGQRRTEFIWLPELSGKTESDAVASQGAYLCSVCFPSAPTEWTDGRERDAAAKAATKCAGGGQQFDPSLPHRTGYAAGNSARCHVCGADVAVTSLGRLRAHKPAA